jgi:hypothetical protein
MSERFIHKEDTENMRKAFLIHCFSSATSVSSV